MENLKRHPAPLAALLGALLAAQSVFWEYARVKPDFRFIVEPWSVRGYELVQGRVIAVISICIGILVIIAWRDVVTKAAAIPYFHFIVAALFLGVAIAIAAIAGSEYTITIGPPAGIAIAVAAGVITGTLLKYAFASRLDGNARAALVYGSPFVLMAVFYVALIRPLLVDEEFTQPVWLFTAIVATPLVLLAVVGEPRELSTNRLLILAVVAGFGYVTLSAGAVRTSLLELQEAEGASALYKDIQITSGMILAFVGMGLAFLGGVGMWAQRRDQLLARKRAAQQREAAEKSAAELTEALELLEPEYR